MATEQGHSTEHSHTTTDHEEIRRWAEERGGRPASVKGTEHGREKAGILRINFPGSVADEVLEDIDWDTFFKKFEKAELAFVYQDETAEGQQSRFGKFIRRLGFAATGVPGRASVASVVIADPRLDRGRGSEAGVQMRRGENEKRDNG